MKNNVTNSEGELPNKKVDAPEPATENSNEDIHQAGPFTEEELAGQLKNKDIAQTLDEILRTQKIAIAYIDMRSGGAFFSGEAHISGDVTGRDQFKQEVSTSKKECLEETVSEVLVSDLEKIIAVYVPPSRYDAAREILLQQHILILHGRAHQGKCTTALHMLHSLHNETLFELNPVADFEALNFSDKPAQGYFIDTYSTESVEKITLFQLNRLRSQLQTSNAHLIITIDEHAVLPRENLEKYLLNWDDLPNQKDIIRKHLDWYACDSTMRQQVDVLCTNKEVSSLLNQPLLPSEVDQLANLLINAASGKLTLAEVLERFKIRTIQQVTHWFESHPAIDDRIFLLSAAVYNGASRQTIINAEKQLHALLFKDEETKSASSDIFGPPLSQRIYSIGATLKPGSEDTEFGRNPVEILELNNPAMQPAVIQYVWGEFDRLHQIIVCWLKEAVVETPFDMRVRAAAAVGELAKHDFSYIRREVLIPWGTHNSAITRGAAAFALGIPAWESEKAPLVLGLLHHWSTLKNWRLCWTAAVAYGGLVGLRFPDAALNDLRCIAQKGELHLLGILTQSIVNLFNVGEIVPAYRRKVIDSLIEWTEKPKDILGTTGLFMFLYMADTTQMSADPEGDPWPTLLWLIRKDDPLAHQICKLWQRALNLKVTRSMGLSILHNWLKIVDRDSRLYGNLSWLFQTITKTGTDREGERLRHFLHDLMNHSEAALTATRIVEIL